jgi:2-dehydropantoate 2-reductase
MRITIIGAGAMGCLFAGMLCESGHTVSLLARKPEQVELINNRGVVIVSATDRRTIRVRATTDPAEIKETDIAMLFVKNSQTRSAADTASRILGNTGYILTLQNGMGNSRLIAEFIDERRIITGTTAHGAMLLALSVIQHSGTGITLMGHLNGDLKAISMATKVAALFSGSAIPARSVNNIKPPLWNKLFVNVGINAITALTGIRNGQLSDSIHSRRLVAAAVCEAVDVAHGLNINIEEQKDMIVESVFAVVRATANNRSSMGQDIDRHNLTEIDAINGYIVRKAKEINLLAPVNQTLVSLIKVTESCFNT